MMGVQHTLAAGRREPTRLALRAGLILGVGVVGTLDQVVLHEMLQWHTFYVHTTQYWRLFIDGIFHVVTASLLCLGAALLWEWRHRLSVVRDARALAAGILFGMGGFQLFDGIVDHKVLQLHPVREGVDSLLPYDAAFLAVAVALLLVGWLIWRGIRGRDAGLPGVGGT